MQSLWAQVQQAIVRRSEGNPRKMYGASPLVLAAVVQVNIPEDNVRTKEWHSGPQILFLKNTISQLILKKKQCLYSLFRWNEKAFRSSKGADTINLTWMTNSQVVVSSPLDVWTVQNSDMLKANSLFEFLYTAFVANVCCVGLDSCSWWKSAYVKGHQCKQCYCRSCCTVGELIVPEEASWMSNKSGIWYLRWFNVPVMDYGDFSVIVIILAGFQESHSGRTITSLSPYSLVLGNVSRIHLLNAYGQNSQLLTVQ